MEEQQTLFDLDAESSAPQTAPAAAAPNDTGEPVGLEAGRRAARRFYGEEES